MKVENLMTHQPMTCSQDDPLALAAKKMWTEDCGILPVLDGDRLVGVITDRDIAMALGMRGASANRVQVGDVTTGRIFSCSPKDEVAQALEVMREHRVRRLPVLDGDFLVGLISLNDIILEAGATAGKQKRPTYGMVVKALRGICEHRNLPLAV